MQTTGNTTSLDPTVKALASAIKKQETGDAPDAYTKQGASGEMGAYQFMPNTWKSWAGSILGDPNAPMTVENQNKVAYTQIKQWKDKGYTPAQVAAAWNAGEGSLKDDSWKTNVGTNDQGVKYDTPSYVKNVSQFYNELKKSIPSSSPSQTPPQGQAPNQLKSFVGAMKSPTGGTANSTTAVAGAGDVGTIQSLGNTGKAIVGSEIGLGQDVAAAIGGNTMAKTFEALPKADQDYVTSLFKLKAQYPQNASHYENLIKNYKMTNGQSITDVFPALNKSNEQVVGDVAGVALDALSGGEFGAERDVAAGGAKVATEGASVGSRLVKGAGTGAALGAGFGLAGGAQQNESATGLAKSAAAGAVAGAVLGGATDAAIGKRPQSKTISDLVDATAGVADKKSRISSLEMTGTLDKNGNPIGGTRQTFLGGVKTVPTASEIERAKAVQGIVKPKASPVVNLTKLNQEISRISEKEIIPALKKAGPISPITDKAPGWNKIVQQLTDIEKPDLIKADTTLDKTYDLVRNRMIEQIKRQPATYQGLWDARKVFDTVVKDQFGDAAFDSEKNTAIKRAISDMRRTVNNIIKVGVPQFGDQLDKLSNMYDARYNIAEQYQSLVNGGGYKAFARLSPKKAAALQWGLGAVGLGVADKVLKSTTGLGY